MDTRLLDILVCPICKSPLHYDKKAQELICNADKLAYPIRDGIPIMWADQARDLNSPAAPSAPAPTGPAA
ncbi:Trm112 family protein [Collimonas sp.]|uniref:Trm112 family protein n=1 Tax=Collimonas sp. TaxID=1963772 RepID=UPI002CA43CBF|nr:Trm112 family protein [Collimonas sp.]HWW04830.1 Trm112 family protein [Collimonas sp.]